MIEAGRNFFVERKSWVEINIEKKIYIMKKRENAVIPTRGTKGSAGLDLYAAIENSMDINPGDLVKIPTGIAISLRDESLVCLVFARSGLGVNHGITLSNGVGIIDSDYRGEIFVGLCNVSKKAYTINPGDRIAQMIVMPICNFTLMQVDNLDKTERDSSGFGSTGK